jgi:hypothetical protein
MPYIKNLKVNKISFVRAAANKREFLLCKSAESIAEGKAEEETSVVITDIQGNEVTLGVDVPTTTPIDKCGGSCGGDSGGKNKNKDKLTKEVEDKEGENNMADEVKKEEAKIDDDVNKASTPNVDVAALLQKMQDENATMKAENATLRTDINKMAEDTRKNEIRSILKSEAPLAPINADETVEMLMELEKAGQKVVAEKMLEGLKKTSKALEASGSFGEIGSSRTAVNAGDDYVQSIERGVVEIAKTATSGTKPSEVYIAALRKSDPAQYEKYRKAPRFHAGVSDFE